MVIRISIPEDVHVNVKAGQMVDFTTPLYTKKTAQQIRLAIAEQLKVPPKRIFQYLKKFVGDTVEKGDVIARHQSLFSTKLYKSEHHGIIKEIRHEDGSIILEATSDDALTIYSYFSGEIDTIEKKCIGLKVKHGVSMELKKADAQFGGKKYVYESNAPMLAESVQDSVLCVQQLPGYELAKCEALGCRGAVALHTIDQTGSSLPIAYLKKIDDWKQIQNQEYTHCLIQREPDTLYLYS